MITIDSDTIYVSEYNPLRVLVIQNGKGQWEPGTLNKSDFRESYYISTRNWKGVEMEDLGKKETATTEEVLRGLQEAICSINERLKNGL